MVFGLQLVNIVNIVNIVCDGVPSLHINFLYINASQT